MRTLTALMIILTSTAAAGAQYYSRQSYAYPGRGYYAGGNRYGERYGQRYAPRYYAPRPTPSYAPRGGYDWSWGGGDRGYLGGQGGGWGREW